MKKYLLKIFMVAIVALPFVACNDDDDTPWIEPVVTTSGVYVIHSGLTNNAELAYYDTETKEVSEKVFKNKNGQDLGDLATDMVVYGSKMYITVTGSNKIFVTDHSAKIISSIEPKNGEEPMKPRKIVAHNGKIYAGTVDGYLLRIDTISYTIEDKIKTSPYPEDLLIYGNTLFVANSGYGYQNEVGYDNTVSAINLSTFKEDKKIELPAYNPVRLKKDNQGNIYVLCWEIWQKTKSSLYKLNPSTYAVTKIADGGVGIEMVLSGDKLLIMKLDYEADATTFSYYNTKKGELINQSFITDGTIIEKGNSLTVDPVTENIYVGTGDYLTKGKMYIFSKEGKLLNQFTSGGYYPMGAYFLTEKTYAVN